jgi:hypothetical protein
MQRHLALVLGVVFVLLGVAAFPFFYYLSLIQQPAVVERQLDPEILFALAIPGTIVELEKEKGIRSLDGTVLELDRNDLNFMLQTGFTPAALKRKAMEVHQSIVDHSRIGPRDNFTFTISIKDELPVFQQNLVRIFRRKMVTRPECSMGQFLGIAWRSVGKLFGARKISPEEQLRRLPRCRPPGMVQEAVVEAVQARLQRAQANAADSIVVRPAFGPKAHRFVRQTLAMGQSTFRLVYVFPILLLGIVLLSWRDRAAMWARLAAPLLITGLLLLIVNIPLYYYGRDLDLFATIQKVDPDFTMSESTGQWLQVVFYLLREVMQVAARHVALMAAFLLLAGLLLVRRHQYCRLRHMRAQIDTGSIGGLGSAPIPAPPSALPQDDVNEASRAVL